MSTVTPGRSDRRGRLLQTAARLFARWGFDKTSVDDIAREAGISKGAVYLEFPTKDALLKAVLHQEFARYSEDWLHRFEQDPGEWSFARMFQHSIAAVNANPFVKAVLTRDQRLLGRSLWRDKDLVAQAMSARRELFAQFQQIGAMRDDIPAPVIAHLVTAFGYGLIAGAEVIPGENQVPFAEAMRGLGLLLDRGLAPPHTKNKEAARKLLIAMVEKMRGRLNEPNPSGVGKRDAD